MVGTKPHFLEGTEHLCPRTSWFSDQADINTHAHAHAHTHSELCDSLGPLPQQTVCWFHALHTHRKCSGGHSGCHLCPNAWGLSRLPHKQFLLVGTSSQIGKLKQATKKMSGSPRIFLQPLVEHVCVSSCVGACVCM